MIFVDTNVLVLGANRLAAEHGQCRRFLEGLRTGGRPWFLSWPVCFEFLRVATHPSVFARPLDTQSALAFLDACLGAPTAEVLVATERHRAVLTEVLASSGPVAGNLWHDVHTATLMREHGVVEIATYDRDFRRFDGLRPVEP